jgi:hypothetical protein
MRKPLLAVLAVLALFAGACGASGDDDSADETTSTTAAAETTDDTTSTTDDTEDTEPDETTTTEDDDASGDLVDVEEWATEFCGDFESWLDGINASSEGVQEGITPGDLEGAKSAIVGLFTDVSGQTRTLIDEIEAGGAPDIDDGEAFHEDLLTKFEDFYTAIDTARSEAEAASTADPAAFQTTISDLVATFQTETETVGNSFSELDAKYGDADLDAAVSASCSFM